MIWARSQLLLLTLCAIASACDGPRKHLPPSVETGSDAAPGGSDAESPSDGRDSPRSDDGRDAMPSTDDGPQVANDGACGSASDPKNCGTCGHDCSRLMNVRASAPVQCQDGKCVIPAT